MQQAPPKNLKPYFMVLQDIIDEHDAKFDWPVFFGNDNPVEIDVGCGRGLFTYSASLAKPDVNYLGIEVDYREARRGAKRLQKRESQNARIIGGDVETAFTKMIAPHSVSGIHVYFPDPWWKRKHRSRRVVNDKFVDLCSKLIVPGGLFHSWTDVEEYFDVISALLDHHPDFISLPTPEERAAEHDMDYQTSYERKKRKLGLPIYRGMWKRKQVSDQSK